MTRAEKMNSLIKKMQCEIDKLKTIESVGENEIIEFLGNVNNITWFIRCIAEIDEADIVQFQVDNISKLLLSKEADKIFNTGR